MVVNIVAWVLTAVVCFIMPIIILGVVIKRNPMERKAILCSFLLGLAIFLVMQWGVKSHTIAYLIEQTSFANWREQQYGWYLFVAALFATILFLIPFCVITNVVFKKQVSFAKATMWGLGYAMAEAVISVGYQSVLAIINGAKSNTEIYVVSSFELYLAIYERILFFIIYIAIVIGLVYFIQQNMYIRGTLIIGFVLLVIQFLPGFFITFSTVRFAETLDRSVSLLLTYVVLTMAAITGITVLNALKYEMKDTNIDSKQAVKAYQKKVDEKKKEKEQKKERKKEK